MIFDLFRRRELPPVLSLSYAAAPAVEHAKSQGITLSLAGMQMTEVPASLSALGVYDTIDRSEDTVKNEVGKHGGQVIEVRSSSVLAGWLSNGDGSETAIACRAALTYIRKIENYARVESLPLPAVTVAITCGEGLFSVNKRNYSLLQSRPLALVRQLFEGLSQPQGRSIILVDETVAARCPGLPFAPYGEKECEGGIVQLFELQRSVPNP